jgi:hypothetical protein
MYCSARCRYQSWDARNRPEPVADVRVRLHWHMGRYTLLAGDYRAGYWRGDGCPPECRGIEDGWSTGVPEGREGIPPARQPIRRDGKVPTRLVADG